MVTGNVVPVRRPCFHLVQIAATACLAVAGGGIEMSHGLTRHLLTLPALASFTHGDSDGLFLRLASVHLSPDVRRDDLLATALLERHDSLPLAFTARHLGTPYALHAGRGRRAAL